MLNFGVMTSGWGNSLDLNVAEHIGSIGKDELGKEILDIIDILKTH